MSKRVRFAALVIVVALVTLCADGQVQPPASSDTTVARLEQVRTFAMTGVGIGGMRSQGERDLVAILLQPKARAQEQLEDVYAHGSMAAKAYALVGMRQLNPDLFQELAAALSGSGEIVGTRSGCLFSGAKLKDVVRSIAAGSYTNRLPAR
jgi:hypothetical protein